MKSLTLALLCFLAPACSQAFDGPNRSFDETFNGAWAGNAVVFSPYHHGESPLGHPPTNEEIGEDLLIASHYWHFLRLMDCSRVTERTLKIISENKLPFRVLLTVRLQGGALANDEANDKEIKTAIRLAKEYEPIVSAVIVGDEAQGPNAEAVADKGALVDILRKVRAEITQPISTSEDFTFWLRKSSKELAKEIDFITVHFHPVWNGRIAEEAIPWADAIYDDVCDLHAGKSVIIGKIGWPTSLDKSRSRPGEEGEKIKAEVNVQSQSLYLKDHYRWVRLNKVFTVLESAFDEDWRGYGPESGNKEVEKNFGVFDERRLPKASFESTLRLFPDAAKGDTTDGTSN